MNFRNLPGLSGKMAKLTNRGTQPAEGRYDNQVVPLPPGEDVILPVEIAHHLHHSLTQGAGALDVAIADVEAVYVEAGSAPEPVEFVDEELGIRGNSLADLLEKVKRAAIAPFQRSGKVDLEDLTVDGLKERADEVGVELPRNAKKDEIIALLRQHEEGG